MAQGPRVKPNPSLKQHTHTINKVTPNDILLYSAILIEQHLAQPSSEKLPAADKSKYRVLQPDNMQRVKIGAFNSTQMSLSNPSPSGSWIPSEEEAERK